MDSSNQLKNSTESTFSKDDTVQVLALDGGGLKGLYTASVIKSIEAQLGHSICRHFDIVTGTSTGGLIALALSLGRTGKEIQDFYLDNGDKIFPSKGLTGRLRSLRSTVSPKYTSSDLKYTLQELLSGESDKQPILGDSQCRLIIPTYRAAESIPRLLKTPHAARYKSDWKMPMWAVGLATSAAPTYLPAFEYEGKTYLDGGLWANNPSLVGVVEAIDLGAGLPNVRVLNIGTTFTNSQTVNFSLFFGLLRFKRGGVLSWATRILPTIMEANSYATANMFAHQLLDKGNLVVVNKQVDRGEYDLDKIDNNTFVEMGEAAGEAKFSQLAKFFSHESKAYSPSEEAMKHGI